MNRPVRRIFVAVLTVMLLVLPAAPARAGLLGSLLGTVDATLGAVVGVVTAGWDDGATTGPTRMSTVAAAIGADDLWDRGIDGRGVDVALVDTGVVPVQGLTGEGKVRNGPDLSFESQSDELRYLDANGHGTHLAGIIAGDDGTRRGFRGVAPGARLVNVRVGAHDGAVDVSQVIAAVDWVVQHRHDDGLDIRVLNLAYGTDGVQDTAVDPLVHAVENAWRHGIVVVVAAGNDGSSRPVLANPAMDPYVLAVGAVDLQGTASVSDDVVAPFSSRTSSGRTVDLVAPGVSLVSLRDPGSTVDEDHPSAVVDDRFFRGSGTSQAAAVTSGAAALLLQARPDLSPDEVKALLRSTADPLWHDDARAAGTGRLDVARAASSWVPRRSGQNWAPSTGTGSLEGARGSSHVADDGIELVGEQDIMGMPWDGLVWAPRSATATAWDGGTWNGSVWTGTCWCATTWAGASWEGRSWTGRSWTGRSWTGRSWTGRSWTGRSWTDGEWDASAWSGHSWTGRNWKARRAMPRRSAVLTLAGVAATVAALLTWPLRDLPAIGPVELPWVVVAGCFTVTEILLVHFEHRSEAHSVSFSAVPLVIGLHALSPVGLVAARLTGTAVALVAHRRQGLVKLTVNLSSFWLGDVLAVLAFRAMLPAGDAAGTSTWLGAFVAAIVADQAQALAITAAIGIVQGRLELLAGPTLLGPVMSVVNTAFALVALTLLRAEPAALLLLSLAVPVLYVSYGVHARLREQHRNLEQLYDFTRSISASVIDGRVVSTLLEEVQELMHADHAWLCVEEGSTVLRITAGMEGEAGGAPVRMPPGGIDAQLHRRAHDGGQPLLLSTADPELRNLLAAVGVRQVLVAPVDHVGSAPGTVVVANRSGEVRDFEPDDLRLFATLVTHAATTLENDHLLEQLRRQAAVSEYQSLHDALTGLPNRSLLGQRLTEALRTAQPLAVLLLDLDRFKEVNDTLGHQHGDVLLRAVAERLHGAVREHDLVARFGGDEFSILLPGVGSEEVAVRIAAGVADALSAPLRVADLSVTVSASIGIALAPRHGAEPASLLSHADTAMYQAKTGRTGIEIYRPERDQNTTDRLLLAGRLRDALDQGALAVHFQPQVDLLRGEVIGAEALVRWAGDRTVAITPQELVALAEHTGMIKPLTGHVLAAALDACARWRAAGRRLRVSVNLSAQNLVDSELVADVLHALDEAGLPPDALCLELTETSVMADPTRTVPVLRALHDAGVGVAIDDFGTGYSSLAYLLELPVDEVKIDKSFVLDMDDGHEDVIVRSVIDLGRNLDLRVVAEGVETDTARRRLLDLGCVAAQGFLFGRPMPASDFAAWLTGEAYAGSPARRRDGRPISAA